ncbi:hypothetical protein BDF14DRAFT_1878586 [Spinellus fusiger]|nr:hypothetical protein BDF14DRAFT_1878586 [Spinellus fusiger]
MELVMTIAEKSTEQFVQFYYGNYDEQRSALANLYRDTSAILWNGNAFSGGQQYSEMLARFPRSRHEIDVYDCHPIAETVNAQGICGMMIGISGTVKFGENPTKKLFHESFVLMPDEGQAGNYYVQSQNFRFV